MARMLKEEFSKEKIEASYTQCCGEDLVKISPEVERITQAIDDLCDLVSKDLVGNCKALEAGFKEKCDEIKRQKLLVRKACYQIETANAGTQCDLEPAIVYKEKIEEVKVTIEKPVVSEKIVEVEVEKVVIKTEVKVEK